MEARNLSARHIVEPPFDYRLRSRYNGLVTMRVVIITALFVPLLVACIGGESPEVEPTLTPDERVEYWAEILAQRQFETRDAPPYLCQVIDEPEGLGLGDDAAVVNQIPREILEAVSIRVIEKLQEKCTSDGPTVPPGCEGIEERYGGVPPFNANCPVEHELPLLPAPTN